MALIAERYRVMGRLGEGGMGVVYRARDTHLHDRPCALKVLVSGDPLPDAPARFAREIRTVATLQSPHIVPLWDHGVLPDGRPYLVMPLLEGQTLAEVLEGRARIAVDRALRWLDGMLLGLAEAHTQGVLHRDIKPENVFVARSMLGQEYAVLLDFGVARRADGGDGLTATGLLVGTPAFMAPELFEGQPCTERSDLYAVGLVAHLLLCGGGSPFDLDRGLPPEVAALPLGDRLAWAKMNRPALPVPGVSEGLGAIVRRLLTPAPAHRFATALDVLAALRRTPEGADALAPLASAIETAAPTVRLDLTALDAADDATAPSMDQPSLASPFAVDGIPCDEEAPTGVHPGVRTRRGPPAPRAPAPSRPPASPPASSRPPRSAPRSSPDPALPPSPPPAVRALRPLITAPASEASVLWLKWGLGVVLAVAVGVALAFAVA